MNPEQDQSYIVCYSTNQFTNKCDTSAVVGSSNPLILTFPFEADLTDENDVDMIRLESITYRGLEECISTSIEQMPFSVVLCGCEQDFTNGNIDFEINLDETVVLSSDFLCGDSSFELDPERIPEMDNDDVYLFFITNSPTSFISSRYFDSKGDLESFISGNGYQITSDSISFDSLNIIDPIFFNYGEEYHLYLAIQRDSACVAVDLVPEMIEFLPVPDFSLEQPDRICFNDYSPHLELMVDTTGGQGVYVLEDWNYSSWRLNNSPSVFNDSQGNNTARIQSSNDNLEVDLFPHISFLSTEYRLHFDLEVEYLTTTNSCLISDSIEVNVDISNSSPDFAEIRWWPGNILGCTADPTEVCYQWGVSTATEDPRDLTTSEVVQAIPGENYQPSVTDRFLYPSIGTDDFTEEGLPNGDKIYFVDLTPINNCNNPDACTTRIYYDGRGFIPRSAAAEDVSYKIVPNPNTGNFEIVFNEFARYNSMTLRDLSGRVVYRGNNPPTDPILKKELDLELSSGLYILSIQFSETHTKHIKVIIN